MFCQLSIFNGHLPCFTQLLQQNCIFTQCIKSVYIDEAHNIHTTGLPHHGKEGFQPVYGKLRELCMLLCKGTMFYTLLTTLPHHILSTIQHEFMLSFDHVSLAFSMDRPNITYTTTPIIGGLHKFRNFNFITTETIVKSRDCKTLSL